MTIAGIDSTSSLTPTYSSREVWQIRSTPAQFEAADDVIVALRRMVEAKDPYTEGHLLRLSRYAYAVGVQLGMKRITLQALRYGALLHDIGKIGIDDAILRKPGALTVSERAIMQTHTIIGERIVQVLRLGRAIAPIIRHHHERWDGHGYPDGLAGSAIPIGARIVAVVDAFDAMTTQRPYNNILTSDQAIAELADGAGTAWDPAIVSTFTTWLRT